MSSLTAEQLEALRQIDSPTVSNAIEVFDVRSRGRRLRRVGAAMRVSRARHDGWLCGHVHGRQHDGAVADRRARAAAVVGAARSVTKAGGDRHQGHRPGAQPVVPHGRGDGHDGESRLARSAASRTVVCATSSKSGHSAVFSISAPASSCRMATRSSCDVNVPVTLDGWPCNAGDLLHGDVNGCSSFQPGSPQRSPRKRSASARRARSARVRSPPGPDGRTIAGFSGEIPTLVLMMRSASRSQNNAAAPSTTPD